MAKSKDTLHAFIAHEIAGEVVRSSFTDVKELEVKVSAILKASLYDNMNANTELNKLKIKAIRHKITIEKKNFSKNISAIR